MINMTPKITICIMLFFTTIMLNAEPSDARAYYNRGTAQFNLGKYDEAIADFDKAIALDPSYAEAYYNRGNAQHSLGKYDEAIAYYDKAIALDPINAKAYNDRGIAQHSLGKCDREREEERKNGREK